MIKVKNLVKSYDGNYAIDHLDLHISKGSVFGLLGLNGAGKTTLVSILNGLLSFEEGEVDVFGLSVRKHRSVIRKRSSLIPQSLALYNNMNVRENLAFFAGIQNIKGKQFKENIDYAIHICGLESSLKKKAGILSGGQKRRLNIAIGLLNNPELLYFDEPTAGVDPQSRNEILESIKLFGREHKTVIYTSHYMPEVEKICDEVAIIHKGKILKQGSLVTMLQGQRARSVKIELHNPDSNALDQVLKKWEDLEAINSNTLVLQNSNNDRISRMLGELEVLGIRVKQIRFDTTSLEALFLSLTRDSDESSYD